MEAAGGSFYLFDKEGLELLRSLDHGHAPTRIPFPLKERSIFSVALKERRPVLVENIEGQKKIVPSGYGGYENPSLLVIPLEDEGGEVFGILSLHDKVRPPFTQDDLKSCLLMISTRS